MKPSFFKCSRFFYTVMILLSSLVNIVPLIHAQDTLKQKTVYVITLNQDIFPAAGRLMKNAMKIADSLKVDYVLIKENTYGGDLATADSIHSLLLHAKPTVLVWITQNAASAGALIALSCDSIYMNSSAIIGAASVVNQEGQMMPDKYQSYMRAMMRSTAEHQGRDPLIAEGMVTPNGYLKDVADTGKIISLTAKEAIKYGYCEGIAASVEEVLMKANVSNYKIIEHQENWIDMIISFLLNPFVNGILLLLILGGIYFEFQNPGAAFPILTSIVAAILYFAPLYVDGLAANWEILLFIIGVLLIAVEIFFFPGHGVWIVTGIVMIITGLTLALVNNIHFDFTFTSANEIVVALLRVVIPLGLTFFGFLFFGQKLFEVRALKGFVLTDTQGTFSETEGIRSLNSIVGKQGKVITPLRPVGQIEIENERYDAMVDGGYILSGEEVHVIEISGNVAVVRKV